MPSDEHRQVLASATAAIEKLRPWSRAGKRAPHKPLLLLLALRRVADGRPRLVTFTEIEPTLQHLIERFSDSEGRANAGYPFWRLQTDGLWEVDAASTFPSRKSNTDPPLTALRSRPALGGFPTDLHDALRANPVELSTMASLVATQFFSDEADVVLESVGFDTVRN
jgi:putative restriction endonuclease